MANPRFQRAAATLLCLLMLAPGFSLAQLAQPGLPDVAPPDAARALADRAFTGSLQQLEADGAARDLAGLQPTLESLLRFYVRDRGFQLTPPRLPVPSSADPLPQALQALGALQGQSIAPDQLAQARALPEELQHALATIVLAYVQAATDYTEAVAGLTQADLRALQRGEPALNAPDGGKLASAALLLDRAVRESTPALRKWALLLAIEERTRHPSLGDVAPETLLRSGAATQSLRDLVDLGSTMQGWQPVSGSFATTSSQPSEAFLRLYAGLGVPLFPDDLLALRLLDAQPPASRALLVAMGDGLSQAAQALAQAEQLVDPAEVAAAEALAARIDWQQARSLDADAFPFDQLQPVLDTLQRADQALQLRLQAAATVADALRMAQSYAPAVAAEQALLGPHTQQDVPVPGAPATPNAPAVPGAPSPPNVPGAPSAPSTPPPPTVGQGSVVPPFEAITLSIPGVGTCTVVPTQNGGAQITCPTAGSSEVGGYKYLLDSGTHALTVWNDRNGDNATQEDELMLRTPPLADARNDIVLMDPYGFVQVGGEGDGTYDTRYGHQNVSLRVENGTIVEERRVLFGGQQGGVLFPLWRQLGQNETVFDPQYSGFVNFTMNPLNMTLAIVDLGGDDTYTNQPAGANRTLFVYENNIDNFMRKSGVADSLTFLSPCLSSPIAIFVTPPVVFFNNEDHFCSFDGNSPSYGVWIQGFDPSEADAFPLFASSSTLNATNYTAPVRLSVILDTSGNDQYRWPHNYSMGATDHGVAVLWDLERCHPDAAQHPACNRLPRGDDRYTAGNVSLGSATRRGVGLFLDEAGKDVHVAHNTSMGSAAQRAVGIAADLAGDDSWFGGNFTMGFGGRYVGLCPPWPQNFFGGTPPTDPEWCSTFNTNLGFDGGPAASADPFGPIFFPLQLLFDTPFDNFATTRVGLGVLLDRRGNDTYGEVNVTSNQGLGHPALGLLLDLQGTDQGLHTNVQTFSEVGNVNLGMQQNTLLGMNSPVQDNPQQGNPHVGLLQVLQHGSGGGLIVDAEVPDTADADRLARAKDEGIGLHAIEVQGNTTLVQCPGPANALLVPEYHPIVFGPQGCLPQEDPTYTWETVSNQDLLLRIPGLFGLGGVLSNDDIGLGLGEAPAATEEHLLHIDLNGNDIYQGPFAGAVVPDLGGLDTQGRDTNPKAGVNMAPLFQGGLVAPLSITIDVAGSDLYDGRSGELGHNATTGKALRRNLTTPSLGGAAMGIGLLYDLGRGAAGPAARQALPTECQRARVDDVYLAFNKTMGYGSLYGVGALVDLEGDDCYDVLTNDTGAPPVRYAADGNAALDRPFTVFSEFARFKQPDVGHRIQAIDPKTGALRSEIPFGAVIIAVGDGNVTLDRAVRGAFDDAMLQIGGEDSLALGAGRLGGLGVVLDVKGNDTYRAGNLSQGAGLLEPTNRHLPRRLPSGIGLHDSVSPESTLFQSAASAPPLAFGALVDGHGRDAYDGGATSLGFGAAQRSDDKLSGTVTTPSAPEVLAGLFVDDGFDKDAYTARGVRTGGKPADNAMWCSRPQEGSLSPTLEGVLDGADAQLNAIEEMLRDAVPPLPIVEYPGNQTLPDPPALEPLGITYPGIGTFDGAAIPNFSAPFPAWPAEVPSSVLDGSQVGTVHLKENYTKVQQLYDTPLNNLVTGTPPITNPIDQSVIEPAHPIDLYTTIKEAAPSVISTLEGQGGVFLQESLEPNVNRQIAKVNDALRALNGVNPLINTVNGQAGPAINNTGRTIDDQIRAANNASVAQARALNALVNQTAYEAFRSVVESAEYKQLITEAEARRTELQQQINAALAAVDTARAALAGVRATLLEGPNKAATCLNVGIDQSSSKVTLGSLGRGFDNLDFFANFLLATSTFAREWVAARSVLSAPAVTDIVLCNDAGECTASSVAHDTLRVKARVLWGPASVAYNSMQLLRVICADATGDDAACLRVVNGGTARQFCDVLRARLPVAVQGAAPQCSQISAETHPVVGLNVTGDTLKGLPTAVPQDAGMSILGNSLVNVTFAVGPLNASRSSEDACGRSHFATGGTEVCLGMYDRREGIRCAADFAPPCLGHVALPDNRTPILRWDSAQLQRTADGVSARTPDGAYDLIVRAYMQTDRAEPLKALGAREPDATTQRDLLDRLGDEYRFYPGTGMRRIVVDNAPVLQALEYPDLSFADPDFDLPPCSILDNASCEQPNRELRIRLAMSPRVLGSELPADAAPELPYQFHIDAVGLDGGLGLEARDFACVGPNGTDPVPASGGNLNTTCVATLGGPVASRGEAVTLGWHNDTTTEARDNLRLLDGAYELRVTITEPAHGTGLSALPARTASACFVRHGGDLVPAPACRAPLFVDSNPPVATAVFDPSRVGRDGTTYVNITTAFQSLRLRYVPGFLGVSPVGLRCAVGADAATWDFPSRDALPTSQALACAHVTVFDRAGIAAEFDVGMPDLLPGSEARLSFFEALEGTCVGQALGVLHVPPRATDVAPSADAACVEVVVTQAGQDLVRKAYALGAFHLASDPAKVPVRFQVQADPRGSPVSAYQLRYTLHSERIVGGAPEAFAAGWAAPDHVILPIDPCANGAAPTESCIARIGTEGSDANRSLAALQVVVEVRARDLAGNVERFKTPAIKPESFARVDLDAPAAQLCAAINPTTPGLEDIPRKRTRDAFLPLRWDGDELTGCSHPNVPSPDIEAVVLVHNVTEPLIAQLPQDLARVWEPGATEQAAQRAVFRFADRGLEQELVNNRTLHVMALARDFAGNVQTRLLAPTKTVYDTHGPEVEVLNLTSTHDGVQFRWYARDAEADGRVVRSYLRWGPVEANGTANLTYVTNASQVGSTARVVLPDVANTTSVDGSPVLGFLESSTTYALEAWSFDDVGNPATLPLRTVVTDPALRLEVASPVKGDILHGTVRVQLNVSAVRVDPNVHYNISLVEVSGNTTLVVPVESFVRRECRAPEAECPTDLSVTSVVRTLASARFPDAREAYLRIAANNTLNSGRPLVVSVGPLKVDNTPPTTKLVVQAPGGPVWFRAAAVVGLEPFDAISGVPLTEYSLDNATFVAFNASAPPVFDREGSLPLYWRSTDEAGNVEPLRQATIGVDRQRPLGTLTINGGAAATRDRNVTLQLQAKDGLSGVATILLDAGGVAQNLEGPSRFANGRSVPFLLPAGDGDKRLRVRVLDEAGNALELKASIVLDTQAPRIEGLHVEQAGHTTATLAWRTSEAGPTRVDYGPLGSQVLANRFSSAEVTRNHVVVLQGLRPSKTYSFRVVADDVLGNRATLPGQFDTLPDVAAPGGVRALAADDLGNGVVRLTWGAAFDDVGIDHYVVHRGVAGDVHALASSHEDLFLDDTALPGVAYDYAVQAVDLAGHEGPLSGLVSARATTRPQLLEPRVSPERGEADQPFTYSVVVRDLDGDAPLTVRVRIGTQAWEMRPQFEGKADFVRGVLYQVQLKLPATTLSKGFPTYQFEADDGFGTVVGPDAPLAGPAVLGDGALLPGLAAARNILGLPGFGASLAALALVAALVLVRKRRGGAP